MSPLRLRPATLALAVVVLVATAAAAGAQTPIPPPLTAPPSTPPKPTTTAFLGLFPAAPAAPPTTAPPGTRKGPPTTPAPGAAGGPSTTTPSLGGDGEPPPGTPRVIPPEFQRQIDSVRRTGPRNTTAWLAAIQPLVTELGMTPTDAAMAGAGRFPIAGPTTWVDDWHYPRFTPSFHLHKGLDMFAASGTPVRAPFDGSLKLSDGAVGGLAAYVTQTDGTYVFMGHLSGFAPGKVTGQAVKAGEVVGFVGDTGNARGGAPHVHLQLHPKGGDPVPPKPTVDGWLDEAERNAAQVVAATRAARNPPTATAPGASVTAVPDGNSFSAETAVTVDPAAALWAAASNPAIGTIDLASSLVASAADGIPWPKPPG